VLIVSWGQLRVLARKGNQFLACLILRLLRMFLLDCKPNNFLILPCKRRKRQCQLFQYTQTQQRAITQIRKDHGICVFFYRILFYIREIRECNSLNSERNKIKMQEKSWGAKWVIRRNNCVKHIEKSLLLILKDELNPEIWHLAFIFTP